jgi:hypothetical protein
MAIAIGGGCGRLATILTTLHLSTMAAPSFTTVTLSTTMVALFAPLCGSILAQTTKEKRNAGIHLPHFLCKTKYQDRDVVRALRFLREPD